jgi:hypothetical protein
MGERRENSNQKRGACALGYAWWHIVYKCSILLYLLGNKEQVLHRETEVWVQVM